ncbi:TonB-dependent receptor [Prolixibacteraceae bacterium Z1-6]|uniref:TonB-dependent receptor n=1 Tax=Draconibacterium aestuarii TaxID=2998507 RepID=A0A9X3F4E7_9BACT|nr:TonB-dependent receptor [Prolixibacteraceae bacterium Z1-6]
MTKRFLVLTVIWLACLLTLPAYSQQLISIKGKIYDSETGDPIVGANILVGGTGKGASSNREGEFELKLSAGEYKLKITSVGFSAKEIKVNVPLANNKILRMALVHKKEEIEGVDVFGNFILSDRDTAINRISLSVLPAVTQISASDIEKQGAVTLTDALKYVPGGWTETRGRKSKQFFSVRGQKYPYPDYSINGIWQKEFEETAYFLSALNIESVEIVRSSSALLKGLSGLTGVIDVKTKKVERETVSLLTKYGENNNYVANLQYGNKIQDISFNTSAAFTGTDGIPGRGGKERISNFHGNVDWALTRKLSLEAGVTYITGLREFVGIVEPGNSKILNQEESFDPLKSLVTYAKLNYIGNSGSQTELQVNYTFRDAKYLNYNKQNETTSSHNDEDWEYGFNFLHSQPLSSSNTLRVGALYNHWVAPDGKRYYAGRRCDVQTVSGVIADEHKFGRLLLDAGFRLIGGHINEWGGFGIEGSASGLQKVEPIIDEPLPVEWQSAMGGSYILSKSSSLHYSFSGGTIAPRKGSLNEQGDIPQNEIRLQHDLGLRIRSQKQNEVKLSAFYTQRNNAIGLSGETITSENDLIVELYENRDKRSYGLELAMNQNIPVLHSSVFANTTFMKNERKVDNKMSDDEELPNVILNAGYLYQYSGVDLNLFVHYTGKYSNNRFVNPAWVAENGDYQLGDFVTADLNCGYTVSRKIPIRIFVEVKNIFDVRYETVAGYPDLGRLFQAGIRLN